MARQVGLEVQLLQLIERGHPLVELSVAHIGRTVLHQVTRASNLLVRKVDDRVAVGVAAAEEQELHLAPAEIDDFLVLEGDVRRRDLDFLQVIEIPLRRRELDFERRLPAPVAFFGNLPVEVFDSVRPVHELRRHVWLDVQDIVILHRVFHVLVRDDVGFEGRIHLVAVGMVIVKMAVHRVTNGLVGDELQVFQK